MNMLDNTFVSISKYLGDDFADYSVTSYWSIVPHISRIVYFGY